MGSCVVGAAAVKDSVDEAVVIVNGEPIPAWELKLLLPQVKTELESQGMEPKGEVLIKIALKRAIDGRLLAQEARRRGIQAQDVRVDVKMARLASQAGGESALETELARSGVTVDQLRSTVVQADIVQTLIENELGESATPTPDEVDAFYGDNIDRFTGPDAIHSRHILILAGSETPQEQRAEARQRAEAARQRALAGEDFAELARELSEGPNAERGGDLGFTFRGSMVEGFDEAVWALDVGEISEVVESGLGYHVITVEEIRPGEPVPLDEVRELVADLLEQQNRAAVISSLVAELEKNAEIVTPGA
jgi:parvulin-like peptidyl-prolyl isomerase